MKIVRNGIEYELTAEEMRNVYDTMREEYLREDIKSSADGMEIELSDETIDYIVRRVDKSLSNNDSYWESYWMTIGAVIEDSVEVD